MPAYVAERLSDRVKNIFTINECARLVYAGYGTGIDAPGLHLSQPELNQVVHNVALGHGLAVQAVRAHGRAGTRVGPAENAVVCIPAIETPANVRAAEIATRELNAGYLTVMLEGKYTDAFLAYAGRNAPKYTAEDLRIISSPIDFVGLNVYMPDHYVVAADNPSGFSLMPFPATYPHMNSTWLRIGPEAMYWAPRHVAKLWNVKSIYISENGTSAKDEPAPDGNIYDVDRIMYLRELFDAAAARDIGRRAGAWLFPVEPDGQFRMVGRPGKALRALPGRLQDTAADPETLGVVLSRDYPAKHGGLVRIVGQSAFVCAPKNEILKWLQADATCPVPSQKYFAFPVGQISLQVSPSRPQQKGRCARHERWDGMRWTRMRCKTSSADADGEVVWSRHPDAGVRSAAFLRTTVANKPGTPGRARRNPLKPFACGNAGMSRWTCGDYARVVCFIPREAAGALGARHSPRPYGRENSCIPRAHRAARRRGCV